ncbi:RodZ domain-containing protein [Niveibacterium sp. SC-1]|uniref:RodZ domain-containing protein n=1 Tax=Niveibacterium sp. SC-1 TaxID=3135646 RepID=UPI00311E5170
MSERVDSQSEAQPEGVAASGEALRQAREARGLTRSDIAQMLKLSVRQIEAIEEERFDKLPGQAWVRGFVRNYARYLDLDPAPLLARLQPRGPVDQRLDLESNAEGTVPAEPNGYKSPSALPALLALVVLVIVGLVFWYSGFATRKHEAPLTANSVPSAQASEPVFPPVSEETAVVTAQVEPSAEASQPAVTPVAAASAVHVPAAASKPLAAQSAPSATKPAAAQSAAAVVEGQKSLEFSFEEDAWVEVRDASGKIVFSRLNKAGEIQQVQGQAPFALVVGNARGVKLRYMGKDVGLAEKTKVNVARLTLN